MFRREIGVWWLLGGLMVVMVGCGGDEAGVPDTGSDAAEVSADVLPDTGPDTVPDADAVEDTQVGPDADAVEDTQVGPDADAVEDTQVGPDSDAAEDTQVGPDADAGDDTQVGPDSDAGEDAQSDADTVEPEEWRTLTIDVIAVSENGQPVSGVEVKVGATVVRGEGASVEVGVEVRGDSPYVLKAPVEVMAYRHASRFIPEAALQAALVAVDGGVVDSSPILVTLASRDQRRSLLVPLSGDTVSLELEGLTLGFAPGSVVDAMGAIYEGVVVVEATRVLQYAGDLGVAPVPFVGRRSGGELVDLESFGMVDVALSTLEGEALAVASDVGVRLSIDAPWEMTPDIGETVPAWSVDPATGLWTEEGVFTYDEDTHRFVTTATHFSWWNVDKPISTHNCVVVTVQSVGGEPIEGASVVANGVSYFGATSARTDALGKACVGMMRLGTAHIEVTHPDFNHYVTVVPMVGDFAPARCSETGVGCKVLTVSLSPALRTRFIGTVKGITDDDAIVAAAGATVFVTYRAGPHNHVVAIPVMTDAAGGFCARVPPSTDIEVYASHHEFGTALEWRASRDEVVDCDAEEDIEIVLGTARAEACIDVEVWPPSLWGDDGMVEFDMVGKPVRFYRGDVWETLGDVTPAERCERGLGPETWGEVIAELSLDDSYQGNSDTWVATGCIALPVEVHVNYWPGSGTFSRSPRPDDWSLFVGECEDYGPTSPATLHDCRWSGGTHDISLYHWGEEPSWSTSCGESSCLELSLWGICGSD